MSWTTKYRPQRIADLSVTSVKATLQQWLSQGWIPQVLLFAGPKGTGKTTAARLLAATLNDPQNVPIVTATYFSHDAKRLPFVEPDVTQQEARLILSGESFSVLEIDAASHRGIDNIRELKDQVQLAPATGVMFVCILDEAHMLTKEAWNALLKLLEEPPAHVVFVLATTELHKIPATIQSRCQVVQFTKASTDELLQTLTRVSQKEKISVTPEVLVDICQRSDGSVRDAIKLLERASSESSETSPSETGTHQTAVITHLITNILKKNESGVLDEFETLRTQGAEEHAFHVQFLTQLHLSLRSLILKKPSELLSQLPQLNQATLEFLLREFGDSSLSNNSLIPFLGLELKALDIIHRSKKTHPPENSKKQAKESESEAKDLPRTNANSAATNTSNRVDVTLPPGEVEKVISAWQEFAALVHQQNQTLAAVIQSSLPERITAHHMRLQLSHQFHVDRLKQPHIRSIIEAAAAQLAQGPVRVEPIMMATNDIIDQPASPSMAVLAAEALL